MMMALVWMLHDARSWSLSPAFPVSSRTLNERTDSKKKKKKSVFISYLTHNILTYEALKEKSTFKA